ncbi:MAG: DUF3187 family protein [Panacagrimonas sp.]
MRRILPVRAGFCLAAILISPAGFSSPLANSNQAALARSFALPALGGTAPIPAAGSWRFALDLSSEYVLDQEGREELLLDGESQHYAFQYGRGWGADFDWSVELPLLHVGGGFMDDLIEGWHDTFSLPNGGREDAPTDRYRYRYLRDGVTVFDVRNGGTRLGDVRLSAGWQLREQLMLRGQLKLPTGDEDRLIGGNVGGAIWADLGLPFPAASGLNGYVSAGLSASEDAKLLGDLQRSLVPFGGLGFAYQAFPALEVISQLYLHAPLSEHTEIDALERPGAQLTLGVRGCFGGGPCLELSFQEDLAVGASPDFGLRFALSTR